ncbi:MAG: hypothetical protein ACI4PC_09100 [Oscillospiraceae bacterium]
MRILVKEAEGRGVNIVLPSRLVLNSLSARAAASLVSRKTGVSIPGSAAAEMIRAINRFRRRHPDWCLVEVDSADGERVRIKL